MYRCHKKNDRFWGVSNSTSHPRTTRRYSPLCRQCVRPQTEATSNKFWTCCCCCTYFILNQEEYTNDLSLAQHVCIDCRESLWAGGLGKSKSWAIIAALGGLGSGSVGGETLAVVEQPAGAW